MDIAPIKPHIYIYIYNYSYTYICKYAHIYIYVHIQTHCFNFRIHVPGGLRGILTVAELRVSTGTRFLHLCLRDPSCHGKFGSRAAQKAPIVPNRPLSAPMASNRPHSVWLL